MQGNDFVAPADPPARASGGPYIAVREVPGHASFERHPDRFPHTGVAGGPTVTRRSSLRQLTPILLLSLTAIAAQPAPVLLRYSLDDDGAPGASDATRVYEAARGRVELSRAMPYSGYHSVEIRDTAGDGRFPELQGDFPLQRDGVLFVHFALLTTDSRETFGVALAGPEWLSTRRDGIGFWLQGRAGSLYHMPHGVPKRLASLRPFSWYLVDIVYRVAPGTYDLVIHEEGRSAPLVALEGQINTVRQPGSGINTLSFAGDAIDDASNVVYYIDDVVLSSGRNAGPLRRSYAGRRKLFVDFWNDARRNRVPIPVCLSPADRRDLGMTQAQVDHLRRQHSASPLEVATYIAGPRIDRSPALPVDLARLLEAATAWGRGCAALENGAARVALEHFEKADRLNRSGRMYGLSTAFALVRLGRWDEIDARIMELRSAWSDDPRLPIALGMIAASRPDLSRAREWLQAAPPRLPPDRSVSAIRRLWNGGTEHGLAAVLRETYGAAAGGYIEDALIVEQYFLAQLWNGWFEQAGSFAMQVSRRLRDLGLPDAAWIERQGDAAFLLDDFDTARQRYQEALEQEPGSRTLLGKLADLRYREGNLEGERQYRQRAYRSPGSIAAP